MSAEPITDAEIVEPASDSATPDEVPTSTALEVVPTVGSAIIRAQEPDEVLAKAARIADSLKKLIEDQKLYADVGGDKKHVEVNGWQALGTLLGALGGEALHAETVWTKRVLDPDGQPVRHQYTALVKRHYSKAQGGGLKSETTYEVEGFDWEACVEIRTAAGVVVGRAEAMCSRAEESWAKSADYAVRSMAETRAESRGYRRAAGWLVAIAGYNPTPAEEMQGVKRDDDEPVQKGPLYGPEVVNEQPAIARRAMGYLLSVDPADEEVTEACRWLAKDAGSYLPSVVMRGITHVAKRVKDQSEGGPTDSDPIAEEFTKPASWRV
jgi:hypothetical protein